MDSTQNRVEVVVFDVNETLSDLEPLRACFTAAGLPGQTLEGWFAATLRDGFALAAAGAHAPFPHVAAGALRTVATRAEGLTGSVDDLVDRVLERFSSLPLHPDVAAGMQRLHAAGVRLVTLSNGSSAVAEKLLAGAGLNDLVQQRLSVDAVGHWKPHPASYAYAVQRCGVPAERVCLVAAHPWDTDGARRAGLLAGWVNRRALPYPQAFLPPDATGSDLLEVATRVLALGATEGNPGA